MAYITPNLGELRPGMEHLNFRVKIVKKNMVRKVKTFTGVVHSILEGEISDGETSLSFAVWNEKIELFDSIYSGDTIELTECFVSSFKGVLQVNVGRDSNAKKVII
jgi:hypothetical protein